MPLPRSPVVLVTGATDGIGLQTAHDLAARGARVLLHGRRADRLAAVGKELPGGPHPAPVRADFASLDEVRAMADELARRDEPIHVLVNNAGLYADRHERTTDGFERTIAVNHLAPFLLTHLLLAAPRGRDLERIVVVSSNAHQSGRLDPEDLDHPPPPAGWNAYDAYATSKLANVLFAVELARRLGPRPTVNALHPGVVSTKLLTQGFGARGPDSLAAGAATSVLLAIDPTVEGATGGYFVRGQQTPPSRLARDPELARAVYERSAALVGVRPL